METPITYTAGTVKSRQNTEISSPAWGDTDHVRFQRDGKLSTIPSYSATGATLVGNCRSIWAQRITGSNVGDYWLYGTHSRLYAEKASTLYNITPLDTTTQNLGTDPIDIVNTETEVSVNFTDIGVDNVLGDRIKLLALTTVGNITAALLNAEHIITEIVGDDEVKIDVGLAATSTTSGGGSVPATVQYQIAAGNAAQVTSTGMGADEFSGGDWGGGGTSTTGLLTYPRIWSFDNFGNEVVMCAGDRTAGDGQNIYIWDGDLAVAPTILSNAPTDCNWVMVVNNSIVALCGTTVKICAIGAGTTWSGLLYREKTLERIDIAHSGFRHGEKNGIIHYGNGVILLKYVGGADIWDMSDLFEDDGVIAPMATARLNQDLVWRGRTGFYLYDGGIVRRIDNVQNEDWIITNINQSSIWHSFMDTDVENQELYLHFPTGAEAEPSDYVILGQGDFTLGKMDRTAAQRPQVLNSVYVLADGTDVYTHFTKGVFDKDWYAKTSFFFADGERTFRIDQILPDANQSGTVTCEFFSKEQAHSTEVSHGTVTFDASTEVVTCKAAGKYISAKFSGSTEATFGKMAYDVRLTGKRTGTL